MKANLGKIMKQVQEMQSNMQKLQEELAGMEVTGQAGGGLVSVVMTGRHEARRVSIDPSLLSDDKEMLEDLLAAAINDAARKLEEASKDKLAGIAGGLSMPPGFKLPF